jgi:hypothetical protein
MIITQLKEGLGNQLFQYFFTKSLLQENYIFDISFYNSIYNKYNRKLEIINYPIISQNFNFINDREDFFKKTSDLSLIKDNFKYLNIDIDPNKNYYFDGYWQNKIYLNKTRDSIIKDTYLGGQELNDKILNKYPFLKEETVSVHIRRKDYLSLSEQYHLLDENYYKQAIDMFGKDMNIVIFSDDIDWCQKNLNYNNLFFINEGDSALSIYLMSLCKNNIISNSTFSFWGAYLNQNQNKKVVAPINWFKKDYSLMISNNTEEDCAKNIILDDWTRI